MSGHFSVHCSRSGRWWGHSLSLPEFTSNTFSVSPVHLGIMLIITFLSGCQDNWFARGLVFWTSVSRHEGFFNMAKIEQKGMFASRFCLSLFPSLRLQGQIQSPYFCQVSVLAYSCTSGTARSVSCCGVHTLPPQVMRSCVSDLFLHLALFVTRSDLLPFVVKNAEVVLMLVSWLGKPGK